MSGFIFSAQRHTMESSTPSRLSRLKRTMKRLNIKELPVRVSYVSDKNGYVYEVLSNAYTAPMHVQSNGSITAFNDNATVVPTKQDELQGILDRFNEGLIDKKQALADYAAIINMFETV